MSAIPAPSFRLPSKTGPIDPDVSQRIDALRTVLIGLIVLAHGGKSLSVVVPETGPVMSFVLSALNINIDAIVVPLFFSISGFLFLRKFEPTFAAYATMCRKKFWGLFVPFILFNLIWIVWLYVFGSIELFGSKTFLEQEGVFNKLLGIGTLPINYPTWFLRDLLLIFLLSPIFLLLFKEIPSVGLLVLFVSWVGQKDAAFYSMYGDAFSFYLGGYLARKEFNMRDSGRLDAFVFPAFAAATLFFVYRDAYGFSLDIMNALFKCYMIFGLVFFWCLSRYKVVKQSSLLHKMAGYSFFIFLAHEPTISMLQTFLLRFWKPVGDAGQLVYYFGSGLTTIFLLYYLGVFFAKYAPPVYAFCVGARASRRPLAQG